MQKQFGVMALVVAGCAGAACAATHRVSFESGAQGWSLAGYDTTAPEGGNPGAMLHWRNFADVDWLELRTQTNAAFLGDLSRYGPTVTLSVDVQVNFIHNWFGNPAPQSVVIELRDFDNPPAGYPWVSVYKVLGEVSGSFEDWRTFAVTFDPTSPQLPDGWGGTGDENPVTYEPRLPANRTFASVLAGVDQVLITTAQPGYGYISGFFDVAFDNITLATPGPACDSIDFNQNEVFPEDQDVIDFFTVLAGGDCPSAVCNDIDFNNNGVFPEEQDVIEFFAVLAGGGC